MEEKQEIAKRQDRKKKKKSKLTPLGRAVVILLCLLVIGGFVGSKVLLNTAPANSDDKDLWTFTVQAGASTKTIAQALDEAGLIRSQLAFNAYVRQQGYDGKLRVGNYLLSPSMTVEEIVDKLLKGIGETKRFTIPEGYTLRDIAAVFAKEGIMSEEDFWQVVTTAPLTEYDFLAGKAMDEHRLEGYLFPDTYIIAVNSTPETVIRAMLDRFAEVAAQLPENTSGLSFDEMVILASMVESEAKLDSERPTIASVYINRLAVGMPMQCDATILYGMPERKERLLYSDLEYDSPYNTYLHTELPPTPICSPGQKSLEAAAQPADTDYYYYLWSNDMEKGHVFAESYNGHLKNRKAYGYD